MQWVEIRIKGHINPSWSEQLGGLQIIHYPSGETGLSGRVVDQSALYGLLNQFASLGLELSSLSKISPPVREPGVQDSVSTDPTGS